MKGVAPLSIKESRLSWLTIAREQLGQQSSSVTISHTRWAAVWSSDGLDWVNDCQSTSPPPPPGPSPLYLSHSTAKSIKQSVAQPKSVLIKHYFNEWMINPSVSSLWPLQLSAWFVVLSFQLFGFFSCSSILKVSEMIWKTHRHPMYSGALKWGLTFPGGFPWKKRACIAIDE